MSDSLARRRLARAAARLAVHARCTLPPNFLNDQHYVLSASVISTKPVRIEAQAENAVTFAVRDTGALREPGMDGEWHGLVRVPLDWATEQITPGAPSLPGPGQGGQQR